MEFSLSGKRLQYIKGLIEVLDEDDSITLEEVAGANLDITIRQHNVQTGERMETKFQVDSSNQLWEVEDDDFILAGRI